MKKKRNFHLQMKEINEYVNITIINHINILFEKKMMSYSTRLIQTCINSLLSIRKQKKYSENTCRLNIIYLKDRTIRIT